MNTKTSDIYWRSYDWIKDFMNSAIHKKEYYNSMKRDALKAKTRALIHMDKEV